ncbi:MAG: hypothetical protein AAGF99_05140 [Bacteroidota bacterium]
MAISVGFYDEFEFTGDISGTPTWSALDPSKLHTDGDIFAVTPLSEQNINLQRKRTGGTLAFAFLYETDEDDTNNTELDALLALDTVWFRTRSSGSSNRIVTGGTLGCSVLGQKLKTASQAGQRAKTRIEGDVSAAPGASFQTTEAVA